jgi:Arylsulfotransferase (ASST)
VLVLFAGVCLVGFADPVAANSKSSPTTTAPTGNAIRAPLPDPRPADFDASGTVSAFPSPGTPTASPVTTITFRGPGAAGLTSIHVTGSSSGAHAGHFQPHPDGQGTTFVPHTAFTPGEKVTVTSALEVRGASNGSYSFTVATPSPFPDAPLPRVTPTSKTSQTDDLMHFVSRPDLTPPKIAVVTQLKGTAPGDIFLTPAGDESPPSLVIDDGQGQPIWVSPQPGTRTLDLEKQTYRGQPVLTWYTGSLVSPGVGQGSYVIADQNYHQITQVSAVNGYAADIHDMTITPQNTALLLIYNPVIIDASSVKGAKEQRVLEPVIQEIDVATGTLLFEWHGLSSIPLKDSYQPVPKTAGDAYDYVHPNSVAVAQDGDLLLSGRHTWTVYKIDRAGGVLDWHLGAKENNFAIASQAESAWQHDVRPNPDGTLTIFDNGSAGATVTHKTRGLVLHLNEQSMTATLVHQYHAPGRVESTSQGSFRLQPNGDYFAGWGDQPEFTEFAPDGTIVYDAKLPNSLAGSITSYRALRYPWTGQPTDLPAVAVKRGTDDEMTVYATWNGATDVARWTVLAGPDYAKLTPLTSVARDGFETAIHAGSNLPYYAVEAIGADGNVLATSGVVTPRT